MAALGDSSIICGIKAIPFSDATIFAIVNVAAAAAHFDGGAFASVAASSSGNSITGVRYIRMGSWSGKAMTCRQRQWNVGLYIKNRSAGFKGVDEDRVLFCVFYNPRNIACNMRWNIVNRQSTTGILIVVPIDDSIPLMLI